MERNQGTIELSLESISRQSHIYTVVLALFRFKFTEEAYLNELGIYGLRERHLRPKKLILSGVE